MLEEESGVFGLKHAVVVLVEFEVAAPRLGEGYLKVRNDS